MKGEDSRAQRLAILWYTMLSEIQARWCLLCEVSFVLANHGKVERSLMFPRLNVLALGQVFRVVSSESLCAGDWQRYSHMGRQR